MKTEKMCLKAVRSHGAALQYVPDLLKTKEMCMEAVRQNWIAIKYLPERFRTKEIYSEFKIFCQNYYG